MLAKRNAKYWAGRLHRWLGLALGAVVLVSYLPAALYVFEPELTAWVHHEAVFVPRAGGPHRPADQLWAAAQAAVPSTHLLSSLTVGSDSTRTYVFETYRVNPRPGWTFFSEYTHWERVYVDPYTGRVRGVVNVLGDWVSLLRYLHQQLLLRRAVGHLVVGCATLALFGAVLTGLVLWWPRTRAALRQRLTLKRGVRWRRRNYDLHNVLGFYASMVILLLATTGLVWSFDWWEAGILRALGQTTPLTYGGHPAAPARPATNAAPLETALRDLRARRAGWTSLYLGQAEDGTYPHEWEGDLEYTDGSAWAEFDTYFYHAATGGVTYRQRQEEKSTGAKWRNSNYAIHVGSLYGWPTRLLVCAATLICASLPVTGFLVWWGRRNKVRPVVRSAVD